MFSRDHNFFKKFTRKGNLKIIFEIFKKIIFSKIDFSTPCSQILNLPPIKV
jgi:hypothetical protein